MYLTYLLIRERFGAICNGNMFVLVCRVKIIWFFFNSCWHETIFLFLLFMGVNTSNKESIPIIFNIFNFILLICTFSRTGNIICISLLCWRISWSSCSTYVLIRIRSWWLFLFIQNIEIVNVNIEFLISNFWILSRGVIHIYFS